MIKEQENVEDADMKAEYEQQVDNAIKEREEKLKSILARVEQLPKSL